MDVGHIFRSYDIRGIYGKDLTEEIMRRIGNAFGQLAKTNTIVIARDMRLSSLSLKNAFISGLMSSGKNVVDAGLLPLGVGMFHAWQNKMEFAYITASHLPREWNGVKFFHADGIGYVEQENFKVKEIFNSGEKKARTGRLSEENSGKITFDYVDYVSSRIKLKKKIKVVLDCGSGMASVAAPELFRRSGADVSVIYGGLSDIFPRNPEPQEDELNELRKATKSADIGIAYDGDGDRMVLVDEKGRKITPEHTAHLLLKWGLKEDAGPIVANVECTMAVDDIAASMGKKLIRFPVGHPYMVKCAKANSACFGMEFTGHFVVPKIFPFDDSLAISLLAVQALAVSGKRLSEIADEVKMRPFRRVNFDCDDRKKFAVIESIKKELMGKFKSVNTMDGIRIDLPEGWALIRASNTAPAIRITAEAESNKKLDEILEEFSAILKKHIATVSGS